MPQWSLKSNKKKRHMLESKIVDRAGTTFGNILTDRLIIRFANPDDAEEIYAYRSDTIENQYQGWFPESV